MVISFELKLKKERRALVNYFRKSCTRRYPKLLTSVHKKIKHFRLTAHRVVQVLLQELPNSLQGTSYNLDRVEHLKDQLARGLMLDLSRLSNMDLTMLSW